MKITFSSFFFSFLLILERFDSYFFLARTSILSWHGNEDLTYYFKVLQIKKVPFTRIKKGGEEVGQFSQHGIDH